MTATPETSAAIYVRRSSAAGRGTDREGRSLGEQEAEARALAERHGLSVVEVYAEREGTGASARSRKARPEWDRALADLETGDRFRTLIVFALDRADRRGAAHIAAILDRHAGTGRRILGCDATDTADETQRLAIILRAEIAREDAEKIARNVSRAKRYARDAGRWLGGRPPYGTRVADGRLEPDPETFPVARRIADCALAGDSIWKITNDLNADGIPSTRGGRWTVGTVAALLRTPGFAGLQSTRRRSASGGWAAIADVYRDSDGRTVSVGTGVISPDERARIVRLLDERTRETGERTVTGAPARSGRREPTSLLAGPLLRCADCGGPTALTGRADGRRSYRCAGTANGKGCRGFTAPEAALDVYVSEAFLDRLTRERPAALVRMLARRWQVLQAPGDAEARETARERLEDAEAAVSRTVSLVASGVLQEDEARAVLPRLREDVESARAALAEITLPEPDLEIFLDSETAGRYFDALPISERRATLALAFDRITVSRAPGRGARFRPADRVELVWSTADTVEEAEAGLAGRR